MQNNYDNLAFGYDTLSRLVFGQSLVRVQTAPLCCIHPGSRVLIAGGGTGWILEAISRLHPAGLDIVYIELSHNMLELSRKRNTGNNTVHFIQQAVETVTPDGLFDVVITGFLFDNFLKEKAQHVFQLLHLGLTPGGLWLFADFSAGGQKGRWWRKGMLRLMYTFFRVLCHVEAKQLVEMEPYFAGAGYDAVFKVTAWKGFIRSAIYKKPTSPNC